MKINTTTDRSHDESSGVSGFVVFDSSRPGTANYSNPLTLHKFFFMLINFFLYPPPSDEMKMSFSSSSRCPVARTQTATCTLSAHTTCRSLQGQRSTRVCLIAKRCVLKFDPAFSNSIRRSQIRSGGSNCPDPRPPRRPPKIDKFIVFWCFFVFFRIY